VHEGAGDTDDLYATEQVPEDGRRLRNLALGCNMVMSHMLHFYHLAALDYVDLVGTGLLPKGPFCPEYSNSYFARGVDPTGACGGAVYTVNDALGGGVIPKAGGVPLPYLGDLTCYLTGQYVRALKFRRMCQQIGALFAGRMPIASTYTPGCVTTKVYNPVYQGGSGEDDPVVQKFHEIMWGGPGYTPGVARNHPLQPIPTPITPYNPHPESVLGFIGKPTDFWTWGPVNGYNPNELPIWAQGRLDLGIQGVPGAGSNWREYTGTYLFDVVAAAHLFPEYFWLGTGYGRLLAYGAYEEAGTSPVADGSVEGGFKEGTTHWDGNDKRFIHRGRTHILPSPPGVASGFWSHPVDHNRIKEFTKYSYYNDPIGDTAGRHPWGGKTKANPDQGGLKGAYTYGKAPRYENKESGGGLEETHHPNNKFLPYEVGPLARMMANYDGAITVSDIINGDRMHYVPGILNVVDGILGPIGVMPSYAQPIASLLPLVGTVLFGTIPPLGGYPSNYIGDGTLDRHAARALETYYIARHLVWWFNALDPTKPANKTLNFYWGGKPRKTPKKAYGVGLTEAPRGALGHWVQIGKPKTKADWKDYRGLVSRYQIITPTAWNVSPLDANSPALHGPIERSLHDTPVIDNTQPVEILRVIHSFDICIACTVHMITPKHGKKIKVASVPGRIGSC